MTSEEPPFGILASILSRKADLFARDIEGWTPLLHAVNERHYTSVAFLLKSCPKSQVKEILAPSFHSQSNPVATSVLMDEVVLLRILADFVDHHSTDFSKFYLTEWAILAADAGRPRSLFMIMHTMHFMCHKLEVSVEFLRGWGDNER